jgi:hypothetical protein
MIDDFKGMAVDRHLFGMKNLAVAKQRKYPGYIIPKLLTGNFVTIFVFRF